ncbi:MAG: ABC transporter ATP-binding protein [Thermomicrobiaceae bacterium]
MAATDTATRSPQAAQGSTSESSAPVRVNQVSKWYGDVVAVSQVDFEVWPGVTALLGPNGSGKTTLLKMLTGLTGPSTGTVTINGTVVRLGSDVYRDIGMVPEQEHIYPFMTGYEFLRLNAVMQRCSDIDASILRVLDLVEMRDAADRKVGEYSKGMRQRIKMAAALVHDPSIVFMDEPLSGLDPRQRVRAIDLIRELGEQGKVVIVSSHLLHEVQRFAEQVLVIVNGHLAASGSFRAIRDKIDEHARQILIVSSSPRRLGASLLEMNQAISARIDPAREGGIIIESNDVRALYQAVPKLAQTLDVRLFEIRSLDDSLASVFSYVTEAVR